MQTNRANGCFHSPSTSGVQGPTGLWRHSVLSALGYEGLICLRQMPGKSLHAFFYLWHIVLLRTPVQCKTPLWWNLQPPGTGWYRRGLGPVVGFGAVLYGNSVSTQGFQVMEVLQNLRGLKAPSKVTVPKP